jgi:hypothetical protein
VLLQVVKKECCEGTVVMQWQLSLAAVQAARGAWHRCQYLAAPLSSGETIRFVTYAFVSQGIFFLVNQKLHEVYIDWEKSTLCRCDCVEKDTIVETDFGEVNFRGKLCL